MKKPLEEYKAKRNFDATPEPSGSVSSDDLCRFVIQQHSATRLHWDLRLEHDGVLVSWALPRGVPWNPKQNHLAVQTEDHPMEYLDFHGEIPEGSYGAGSMFVWDTGTYEIEEWLDRKAVVVLDGKRVSGKYALFATRGRDWIIHRMDPPADPTWQSPPTGIKPARATKGRLPASKEWAFELKWKGLRALLSNEPGLTLLHDENGQDISAAFPEIRRIGRAIGAEEVILDGVITTAAGMASLERRLAAKSDSTVRKIAKDQPAAFVAFDLIWRNGHPCWDQPWRERRELLEALALDGDNWKVPTAHIGDGAELAEAAKQSGVEALMAKRTTSPYVLGEESADWVEVSL